MAGILRGVIAAALAVAGTAADAAEWRISETTTPLTGAPATTAVLASVQPLTNMLGLPQAAFLAIGCNERQLSAFVVWPQVLSIDDTKALVDTPQTMVLWRVDDGDIAVNFWDRSPDGTGAGKLGTGGAMKILRKLAPAHKLVVRMTGTITQDAVFDLSDAAPVIARVEQACGVSATANH